MKKRFIRVLCMLVHLLLSNWIATAQVPVINNLVPRSEYIGEEVEIRGTGFPAPSQCVVYFGATKAQVLRATTSGGIMVRVPVGCTYGPVSLLNTQSGLISYSQPFTPKYSTSAGLEITPGSFYPGLNFSFPGGSASGRHLSINDMDVDGKPDIVCGFNNGITVYRNQSNFSTNNIAMSQTGIFGGINVSAMAVTDINNDGKYDIIASAYGHSRSLYIYRNTSVPGFVSFASPVILYIDIPFNPLAIIRLKATDFDRDGRTDLLAGIHYQASKTYAYILHNKSSSTYYAFLPLQMDDLVLANSGDITAEDVNHDDKPELLYTEQGIGGNTGRLIVRQNQSSPGVISFKNVVSFAYPGASPNKIALFDNRTSVGNVAVTDFLNPRIFLFKQPDDYTPDITQDYFSRSLELPIQYKARDIAVDNISGRDLLDLATCGGDWSSSITVWSNDSHFDRLHFPVSVNYNTGSLSEFIALGDINGDQLPDMITLNSGDKNLSIFKKLLVKNVTISSFSPTSGLPGTLVTVKGTGFSPVPSNNFVSVGGNMTASLSSTETSLTFTLPTGSRSGPIYILNVSTNLAGYSTQSFIAPLFNLKTGSDSQEVIMSLVPNPEWSIYPNPVKQGQPVTVYKGDAVLNEWRLFDAAGQLIKSSAIGKSERSTLQVSTEGLKAGIYLLHLYLEGEKKTFRFIVKE